MVGVARPARLRCLRSTRWWVPSRNRFRLDSVIWTQGKSLWAGWSCLDNSMAVWVKPFCSTCQYPFQPSVHMAAGFNLGLEEAIQTAGAGVGQHRQGGESGHGRPARLASGAVFDGHGHHRLAARTAALARLAVLF